MDGRPLGIDAQIARMKAVWPFFRAHGVDRARQRARWVGVCVPQFTRYRLEIRYALGLPPEVRVLDPPLVHLPDNPGGACRTSIRRRTIRPCAFMILKQTNGIGRWRLPTRSSVGIRLAGLLRLLVDYRSLGRRRTSCRRSAHGSAIWIMNYVPPRRSDGTIQTARIKQPWPKDRLFRILSIDGGGIRGVFPAAYLAELEARYLSGASIAGHFDMNAGTSTGGIIALALAHGMTATQTLAIYTQRGPRIFPTRRGAWGVVPICVGSPKT